MPPFLKKKKQQKKVKKDTSKKKYQKRTVPFVRSNKVKVNKPTHRATWKLFERNVAKDFGTDRTPGSGGIRTLSTGSDTLHDYLYIECKLRDKLSILSLYLEVESKARLEGKIPFLALKQKGSTVRDSIERSDLKAGETTITYLIVCEPQYLQEITKHYVGQSRTKALTRK